MIYGIYSVRDTKMGFAQPLLDSNDDTAKRNFAAQCQNANVNPTLFYYPEDYSLYKIGEYDTENGKINPFIPPVHLIDAVMFKKDEE